MTFDCFFQKRKLSYWRWEKTWYNHWL